MNTDTGELYRLNLEGKRVGDELFPTDLTSPAEDAKRALEALERGERIVAVEDAVAQKIKLGERELARRQRRRAMGNVAGT